MQNFTLFRMLQSPSLCIVPFDLPPPKIEATVANPRAFLPVFKGAVFTEVLLFTRAYENATARANFCSPVTRKPLNCF
jgi:hypothetical protein